MSKKNKTLFIILSIITFLSLFSTVFIFSKYSHAQEDIKDLNGKLRIVENSAVQKDLDQESNGIDTDGTKPIVDVNITDKITELKTTDNTLNDKSNIIVCNSNMTFDLTNNDKYAISCGDTFTLDIIHIPSDDGSALLPSRPIYNENYIELVSYSDKYPKDSNDNQVIRTYKFKAIKSIDSTYIAVGSYEEWNPNEIDNYQQKLMLKIK